MAPSEKQIHNAILKAAGAMFHSDERDQLSVNAVRSRVEAQLKLAEGFLGEASWKQKSKETVKTEINRLLETEQEAEVKPTPSPAKPKPKAAKAEPSKKPIKRAAAATSKPSPRKRQKKDETSESELDDSPMSSPPDSPDANDQETSDEPKPAKAKKVPARSVAKGGRKAQVERKRIVDSEDEGGDAPTIPEPSRRAKAPLKSEIKDDSDDDLSILDSEDVNDSAGEAKVEAKDTPRKKAQIAEDSDSEMSEVIDEPPKRKGKAAKGSKVKAAARTPRAKATADLTPDEVEMKTLQSQLVKCGIRKIWAFELKQYGDDSKAKLRHLKSMLKDVGMEGRFSDAKAADIKEARELAADLEAVTEGAALWGDGRSSRNKVRKSMKLDDSEDDAKSSQSKSSIEPPVKERAARAKQDLAFLGDEESDSD